MLFEFAADVVTLRGQAKQGVAEPPKAALGREGSGVRLEDLGFRASG